MRGVGRKIRDEELAVCMYIPVCGLGTALGWCLLAKYSDSFSI